MTIGRKMDAAWRKAISLGKRHGTGMTIGGAIGGSLGVLASKAHVRGRNTLIAGNHAVEASLKTSEAITSKAIRKRDLNYKIASEASNRVASVKRVYGSFKHITDPSLSAKVASDAKSVTKALAAAAKRSAQINAQTAISNSLKTKRDFAVANMKTTVNPKVKPAIIAGGILLGASTPFMKRNK